jgi:2-(1,2-epoxy-1,2-dihydrophenyl)acetyl-CoA isomerase
MTDENSMRSYRTVGYEVTEGVATVTLNRPEAMNSFNAELRADLAAALQAAADDAHVRVVVLAANGRVFSAGADLKAGFPDGPTVLHQLREEYKPGLMTITEMDKPVISVVQGSAAGIGLSYALAADLVVMGESAFLLAPFSNIGLIPDGGANWLLPQALGYRLAFQLAIENERLPAARCLELGLVNRVVADERVREEAQAWAASLAQRAPLALGLTKRAMRSASQMSFSDAIDYEAELQARCIDSDDCREGVTAFLEKRRAIFKGR